MPDSHEETRPFGEPGILQRRRRISTFALRRRYPGCPSGRFRLKIQEVGLK